MKNTTKLGAITLSLAIGMSLASHSVNAEGDSMDQGIKPMPQMNQQMKQPQNGRQMIKPQSFDAQQPAKQNMVTPGQFGKSNMNTGKMFEEMSDKSMMQQPARMQDGKKMPMQQGKELNENHDTRTSQPSMTKPASMYDRQSTSSVDGEASATTDAQMMQQNSMNGSQSQSMSSGMSAQTLAKIQSMIPKMEKNIAQIEKTITKATEAGATISADVSDAITAAKAGVATVKSATEMNEDVQMAMEDVQTAMTTVREVLPELKVFVDFPKIQKQAEKALSTLTKSVEKVASKLTKAGFDTSSTQVAQESIAVLKKALDDAKASVKAGDAEEAMTILQEDFYGNINDAYQSVGMLNGLINAQKTVKVITKGIASAEKVVAKLKAKNIDTTEAQSAITSAKAKLTELNTALKASPVDTDTVQTLMEEINALRDQYNEALNAIAPSSSMQQSANFFGVNAVQMPKELQPTTTDTNIDFGSTGNSAVSQ